MTAYQLTAFIVATIAAVIIALITSQCQIHRDTEYAKAHIEDFKKP